VGPKAFDHENYTGEEIEAAKSALFEDILPRVNIMLSKQKFLISSNEPTVVDIIFYNEISTAIMLTNPKGFKKTFPNIEVWLTLMGEIAELGEMDDILLHVIEKYKLEWDANKKAQNKKKR